MKNILISDKAHKKAKINAVKAGVSLKEYLDDLILKALGLKK